MKEGRCANSSLIFANVVRGFKDRRPFGVAGGMKHSIVPVCALLAASATLAGCHLLVEGLKPARAIYQPAAESSQKKRAASNPSELRELSLGDLPAEFHFDHDKLYVEPGTPTTDDPHVVLGTIKLDAEKVSDRTQYVAMMKAEAAKHGANAIVFLDEKGERCALEGARKCRMAAAVFLSDKARAPNPSSEVALSKWLEKNKNVGAPEGPAKKVDLGDPPSFEVSLKRGDCVQVVVALDENAKVSYEHGVAKARVVMVIDDKERRVTGVTKDWGSRERVLSAGSQCAKVPHKLRFALGAPNENDDTPIGSGNALVQVFRRKVDWNAIEADRKRQQADPEYQRQRQQDILEVCGECGPEWRSCVAKDPNIRRGQCERFNSCVSRSFADVKPNECPVM